MISSDKNLPLFPEILTGGGIDPFYHESIAYGEGFRFVAGVDEAGRGPLAGPVVAAAVILPQDEKLPGIKDSKKMTERARTRAFSVINQKALAIGIGVVSHKYIDEHNILGASLEAMKKAGTYLEPAPDFILVDGIHKVPEKAPQRCIKKGDQLSHSISAASIIAKVYRDRIMCAYHNIYPDFGFDRHKGYGTKYHLNALRQRGPSPIHRLTFKGVR